MRPLRFVALSEDGKHFVLAPDVPEAIDSGERFVVAIDDRLRAAARGDLSRMGQIELELESQLRPKEIQARIRAGDTPDAVAAAAGIRIERVMSYAHPVLEERRQIALRAQTARVRIDDSNIAQPTLIELISDRLLIGGNADKAIDWDARRLPDGQWEVSSTWSAPDKTVTAHWRFDTTTRTVFPGNKDTIAMVEPPPRLSAVPTPVDDPSLDETPTGPIPLVRDDTPAPPEPIRRPRKRTQQAIPRDVPLEQLFLTDELADASDPGQLGNAGRRQELREEPEDAAHPEFDLPEKPDNPQDDTNSADASDSEDTHTGSKDKKPRIPSWDDIVFGVKRRK